MQLCPRQKPRSYTISSSSAENKEVRAAARDAAAAHPSIQRCCSLYFALKDFTTVTLKLKQA